MGGRRVEGAAAGGQRAAVDGVVDGAAHPPARKQRARRVQRDVVDLGCAIDEVALLSVARRWAVRAVEALEASAVLGGDAVDGVVETGRFDLRDGAGGAWIADRDIDPAQPSRAVAV